MAIAERLSKYLKEHEVSYRLVKHPHSGSSMETAEQAHVRGDALAKGVVVEDAEHYLVVVVPSDYLIDIDKLRRMLNPDVEMATEEELWKMFPDCERGAVPPIGFAYGLQTVWDPNTSLGSVEEVYFEAGDHDHLVRLSGKAFHELMSPAARGKFSHHL